MLYDLIVDTSVTDSYSRIAISQLYVRKTPILKSWSDIFIFTLLNFPEGTLFNRVNPLRANIVSSLPELYRYPYCGHSTLMGRRKQQWQDVKYVLTYFGGNSGKARKEYLDRKSHFLDRIDRPALARVAWNIMLWLEYFGSGNHRTQPLQVSLPWRELYGIQCCRCNTWGAEVIKLSPCKSGLGQGSRPGMFRI